MLFREMIRVMIVRTPSLKHPCLGRHPPVPTSASRGRQLFLFLGAVRRHCLERPNVLFVRDRMREARRLVLSVRPEDLLGCSTRFKHRRVPFLVDLVLHPGFFPFHLHGGFFSLGARFDILISSYLSSFFIYFIIILYLFIRFSHRRTDRFSWGHNAKRGEDVL